MGISERKAREREQRRNAIIDAAETVFFKKGRQLATMDDVAQEAEFSKGTIYLYFKNKEELYLAIHQRGLRILRDLFLTAVEGPKSGLEKILAIGQAYFKFSIDHKDYFSALIYYESHEIDFNDENTFARECFLEGEQTLGVVIEAISRGIADGSIRNDLDPVKTAVVLWGQTSGLIQLTSMKGELLRRQYGLNSEETINYMVKLVSEQLQNK